MKTDYAETVKALNEVLDKLKEIQNRKPPTFKEYLKDAWKGFLITLNIKRN